MPRTPWYLPVPPAHFCTVVAFGLLRTVRIGYGLGGADEDPNLMAGHVADVERVLPGVPGVGGRNLPAHLALLLRRSLGTAEHGQRSADADRERGAGLPDGQHLHV